MRCDLREKKTSPGPLGPGEVVGSFSFLLPVTRYRYPSMSVAGFIQPLRPVRCRTPAGAWLLPSGGFRGEPPVPLWRGEHARRGGNMVYPYFCAGCGAFALFRFRSPGPFPVFEAPLRHLRRYSGGFSGDRGSPFAIPACSGRHSGATRFAGYGQCKPVGISPPALLSVHVRFQNPFRHPNFGEAQLPLPLCGLPAGISLPRFPALPGVLQGDSLRRIWRL